MPGPASINEYERKRLRELGMEDTPPADPHTEAKKGVLSQLISEMGDHIARRLSGGGDEPPAPDAPPDYVPTEKRRQLTPEEWRMKVDRMRGLRP